MRKSKKAVVKPTNPKDAIGIKKVPMSCLSSHSVALVAQAYVDEGLDKLLVSKSKVVEHFNAAIAYLMLFWEGVGDDDRIPQLARAMAHTVRLREIDLMDTVAPGTRTGGLHVKELNKHAEGIIKKIKKCEDPFTQLPAGTTGFKVDVTIDKNTPFHVLPWRVIFEASLGMMEGGRKYGRHNYRAVGVRASVYYDATMRHTGDWLSGKSIDSDSNLSHLTKAISSCHVLLDSMIKGNWIDDRPIRITQ